MAEELFIPKLGQTVEEVTLINWLVKDGDKVEAGQGVLEVETDKAVFTVESPADGYIHMGPFKVGDVIPNLTVVAVIGKKEEKFTSTAGTEKKKDINEMPAEKGEVKAQPGLISGKQEDQGRKFISPRARKLANEKKVDISNIKPTGGEGIRIVEKDVLDYLGHEMKASPLGTAHGSGCRPGSCAQLKGQAPREKLPRRMWKKPLPRQRSACPASRQSAAPLPEAEVVQRIPLKRHPRPDSRTDERQCAHQRALHSVH